MDIAVSGFGRNWRNAECHDITLFRQRLCGAHAVSKSLVVPDRVIRRHDQNKRFCALSCRRSCRIRGKSDGRGRVAGSWLKQEKSFKIQLGKALGGIKAVTFIADNERLTGLQLTGCPLKRILEQSPSFAKIHKLLGIEAARQRPQPGSAPPAEYHGIKRYIHMVILSIIRIYYSL